MSSLVQYENYERPLAGYYGFGQTQQESWFRRNWPFLMQIVGLAFITGGIVAKQYIDRTVPQEKIPPSDWEMLVDSVQRIYPQMPRTEIERKLCEMFGDRSPTCANLVMTTQPSPAITEVSEGLALPSWFWLAAIGLGAVLLLKR